MRLRRGVGSRGVGSRGVGSRGVRGGVRGRVRRVRVRVGGYDVVGLGVAQDGGGDRHQEDLESE